MSPGENGNGPEIRNPEAVQESVAAKPTDTGQSTPQSEAEFWGARECLTQVRSMANLRHTSPWSVLGVCIARVLSVIPPWITLPPIIGGPASLNFFVAVVANSGIGKGASEATARELVPFDDMANIADQVPAGSGEGLAHAYVRRATTGPEKGSIIRERNACLFTVPEVDTLTEIGRRQGSTVMSKLRSAYSGEEIGFFYADPAKRLLVGPHQYRLCLTLGVQPERAEALLSEQAGGTPQRFVWLPATDPQMIHGRGRELGPIRYVPLREWGGQHRSLSVPDTAQRAILKAHIARHRGQGDALDGHMMLTRLKVMVALAAMDGRTEPNGMDWHLAGMVMAKSDSTRTEVANAVLAAKETAAAARGHEQGIARDAATASAEESKVRRFQVRLARKLDRGLGRASQRELLHAFNGDDRVGSAFAEALRGLLADGLVVPVGEADQGEAINQVFELTSEGYDWLRKNGGQRR